MTESFSPQQQLKAFINAAQYLAGLTSGQDIWEEAGKVLVRFFGADVAAFGKCRSDGGIEIGHWAFSENGRGAWFPEPEMIAPMREVFESGFLTFISSPAVEPIAAGFFPILLESRVLAVMLVGHLSPDPLAKETLDLYLAAAGLIGATYSRRISETAVLKAKEELEQRVVERTTELSAANASLRDSRSAALKMMEDAVVARRQAEEANARLQMSEVRFRTLFETMTEGFSINEIICDDTGKPCNFRYLEVNPTFERHTGLKAADIVGRTVRELFPETEPVWIEQYGKAALTGEPAHFEGWFGPLGRCFEVNAYQTEPGRFAMVFFDVTERKQAEEVLQDAHDELAKLVEERTRELREKEVLLKEVHHRVKNNLQVISSLVGLQADGSTDETVREVLRDVTYRVRSMALVHEKLYQSADLARIDFAEYVRSLLSYLWRAHGAAVANVRMMLDLSPVLLPVDTAVPCGLILNELAGNALKHAFRGRSEGEVTVSLHNSVDGNIHLIVHDNGVGLPAGFDWRQAPSLGLRLVQMLARQIDAEVKVSCGEGTSFELVFSG